MGGTLSVTTPCRILDSSDVSDGQAVSIFRMNELVQVTGRITHERHTDFGQPQPWKRKRG